MEVDAGAGRIMLAWPRVSSRTAYVLAVLGILGALTAVAVWNAHTYPSINGYDAYQHRDYARTLVYDGHFPSSETRSEYYKPPGYYGLAGTAVWFGEWIGLTDDFKAGQYLNVPFLVASALLVLLLARLLWPGRAWLQLGALAFFASVPVVPKTAAMFHPGTLALFMSALVLYLAAQIVVRRAFRPLPGAALALTMIFSLLVLSTLLWVYATVILCLLAAALARYAPRRVVLRTVAVVVGITVVLAAPWYIRQAVRYGNPLLGGRETAPQPFFERRPAGFYTGTGLPDVFSHPYRPSFVNELAPTTYTELWGDYFGVFDWGAATPPTRSARIEMSTQSWVGLLPTALALVGWVLMLARSLRRRALARAPARLLVSLLPGVALAGYLYYVIGYPTVDGDVLKATFMIVAAPAWALAFGYGLERLARFRLARLGLLLVLGVCALLNLRFVTFHSPLYGLL